MYASGTICLRESRIKVVLGRERFSSDAEDFAHNWFTTRFYFKKKLHLLHGLLPSMTLGLENFIAVEKSA